MTKRQLVMLAGGGHARVVLDAVERSGRKVCAILDPSIAKGQQVFGVPVVGDDSWLDGVSAADYLLINGAGALPRKTTRQRLYERAKQRGFTFATVTHPSAILGRQVELLEGTQIMAGTTVQCGSRVGINSVINTGAQLDHDCQIGEHAFIGPGVVLCGNVCVGSQAFVGAGAVVLPGVAIGECSIIGAGAVVTRNVPEGTLVVGNPAVQIKGNQS